MDTTNIYGPYQSILNSNKLNQSMKKDKSMIKILTYLSRSLCQAKKGKILTQLIVKYWSFYPKFNILKIFNKKLSEIFFVFKFL